MAKNKISEWSSTAANNTDIGGIDIAEGCAPSGINNAIREMMAQVKDMQSGTDADNFTVGGNLSVTGTSTLTGAVTAPAGVTANITGNVTGNVTGTAANVTGTVAIANGGTGQTTASAAFDALKQTATDTATGVVEKATTAEAQAFTADKFIDGALLALAFQGSNQSLATNGYQKFPGGLIIQWGYASVAANTTSTINLSVTYTTAHLACFATVSSIGSNQSSNQNASTGASNLSTSQIQVRNGLNAVQTLFWFSIGY